MAPDAGPANSIITYAKSLPRSTYVYFFDFVVGVTALLVFFQYAVLHLIPAEFTLDHIYLNVTTPNVSSMFLSNYMHNPLDPTHIANNLPATVFLLLAIFLVGTILLPAAGCPLPQRFFPATYLVFFLLLPFPISGISIWSARLMGKAWSSGFSGINFALLGLLFFLALVWLYAAVLRDPDRDVYRSTFALLSATILTVGVVIAVVLLDLQTGSINVCGHLGGFLLGLLVPSLIGVLLTAERRYQRYSVASLIGVVLLVPAVGWMVV